MTPIHSLFRTQTILLSESTWQFLLPNITKQQFVRRLLFLIALIVPQSGFAAKHALVVGNSNYKHTSALDNPGNDATDIASKLTKLGFEVMLRQNLGRDDLIDAVSTFRKGAKGAEVVLFFYAGHATQFDDKNYLLPVDADPASSSELADQSVSLQSVLSDLEPLAATRILILDACRDNPFASVRSLGATRGLRREKTDNGTLIAYATKPGDVAEDGDGRNSPFTESLLAHIDKPIEISAMLRRVRADVLSKTNQRQRPWENSSLINEFYFTRTSLPVETQIPPPFAMVQIPKGCFVSGSPDGSPGRNSAQEPRKQLCTPSFNLSATEITVGQYRKFIQATGYLTDADRNSGGESGCFALSDGKWSWVAGLNWQNPGYDITDNHPVSCVSWNDANAYTQWLQTTTGKRYQLPTESQWEMAARANSDEIWPWGNSINNICSHANVADSTLNQQNPIRQPHNCSDFNTFAAPVSSFAANKFGVYDMIGNVWEWTCSSWSPEMSGPQDICDHTSNNMRTIRGGGWYSQKHGARSAVRDRDYRYNRYSITGFRVVLNN